MRIKRTVLAAVDFLLFSNIFIALCAIAQTLVTYKLLNIKPDPGILAYLFLGTLFIYNASMLITRPADPGNSRFRRVRWIFGHHRLMVTITLIAGLALFPLTIFYLSLHGKVLMLFTGAIACAYNLPFLVVNNKKIGLRNLPGIKLFLIALVWSVSVVIFPIVEAEALHKINISLRDIFLLAAKRFLFIAAITIPFDIRDLFQDKLYALKTIPVMLGEQKAKMICLGMLLAYLLLLFLFTSATGILIGLSVNITLTCWLIFRSGLKKNEYYYFLFLDGTMILQWLILAGIGLLQ